MKCPSCGSKNKDDEVFCAECGVDMVRFVRSKAPKIACPECGTLNPPFETNCRECRAKLPNSLVLCPDCARENLASARWCVFCDANLETEVPKAYEEYKPPEPLLGPKSGPICCPKCSAPMEAGYLIVFSGGRAVRWANEPDNVWATKGVPILTGDVWKSTISMQGFRCDACRVVTVRY